MLFKGGIATIKKIIFSSKTNSNLTDLSLTDIPENSIPSIVENLVNLTSLTLLSLKGFPRDKLRLIFLKLTKLNNLCLTSDGTSNILAADYSDSRIGNLKHLKNVNFKGLRDCPEICLKNLSEITYLENLRYDKCYKVAFLQNEILMTDYDIFYYIFSL